MVSMAPPSPIGYTRRFAVQVLGGLAREREGKNRCVRASGSGSASGSESGGNRAAEPMCPGIADARIAWILARAGPRRVSIKHVNIYNVYGIMNRDMYICIHVYVY